MGALYTTFRFCYHFSLNVHAKINFFLKQFKYFQTIIKTLTFAIQSFITFEAKI